MRTLLVLFMIVVLLVVGVGQVVAQPPVEKHYIWAFSGPKYALLAQQVYEAAICVSWSHNHEFVMVPDPLSPAGYQLTVQFDYIYDRPNDHTHKDLFYQVVWWLIEYDFDGWGPHAGILTEGDPPQEDRACR